MIKVLRDFVAVEKDKKEEEKKSAGGLIMVSVGDGNRHIVGNVVAVGSGHVSDAGVVPLEVKVGDKITFSKSTAVEVSVNDVDYWVLREDSVLAVL
jgi:chaperonin GroES